MPSHCTVSLQLHPRLSPQISGKSFQIPVSVKSFYFMSFKSFYFASFHSFTSDAISKRLLSKVPLNSVRYAYFVPLRCTFLFLRAQLAAAPKGSKRIVPQFIHINSFFRSFYSSPHEIHWNSTRPQVCKHEPTMMHGQTIGRCEIVHTSLLG